MSKMIDIKTVVYLIVGIITIGGAVIAFFTMQTRQNMKIGQLEKDIASVKDKQTKATTYQIQTEKNIVEINTKLDNIIQSIEELKNGGCALRKV